MDRKISSVELTINYSTDEEPLVFSAARRNRLSSGRFVNKFLSKVSKEFYSIEGDHFFSEEEKFRKLKNEGLELEILEKKNELIDVESVLIFIQKCNTLFVQELDNTKKAMMALSPDKKEEITQEFSRLREVYSSEEFFSRTQAKAD